MQRISFLHCADIHLGNVQYNEPQRQNDFADAFRQVSRYALDKRVDFILICGDFFHKRAINAQTLQQAVELLAVLKEAGIPVITIEGNHDKAFYLDKESWLGFLNKQGFIHLLAPSYQDGKIVVSPWDEGTRSGTWLDVGGVRIYGAGYLGVTTTSRLEEFLQCIKGQSGQYSIFMLHAAVNRLLAHEMAGIRSEQLEPLRDNVDYLALGHIHSRYEIAEWIYNPGSLECVHLDEFGAGKEKGFYHVTIKEGQKDIQYIPSIYRPVHKYIVNISESQGAEAVYSEIHNSVSNQRPVPGAQVQIVLQGDVAYNPMSLNLNSFSDMLKEEFSCMYVEIINNLNLPAAGSLEMGSSLKREDLEKHVFSQLLLRERNWDEDKLAETVNVIHKIKEMVIDGEDEDEALKMLIQYGDKLLQE